MPSDIDLRDESHPLHGEYVKWQKGEPHLCLSCGKAPPFNGCSALCPRCASTPSGKGSDDET